MDEEEELNSVDDSLENIQWNEFANRQQSLPFTGNGVLIDLPSASKVLSLFLE